MSLLVTVDRYQVITGDTASAASAVTGALIDAQALLEEELDRGLDEQSRAERMYPDSQGRLYPKCTPITVPPSGLLVDGNMLYSSSPFRAVPEFIFEGNWVDLTYTGGYVERTANPDATNRLPEHVERDLAWCAFRALNPAAFQAYALMPAGASRVDMGDAMVMFGNRGAPGEVRVGSDGLTDPVWSRATMRLSRKGRRV